MMLSMVGVTSLWCPSAIIHLTSPDPLARCGFFFNWTGQHKNLDSIPVEMEVMIMHGFWNMPRQLVQ